MGGQQRRSGGSSVGKTAIKALTDVIVNANAVKNTKDRLKLRLNDLDVNIGKQIRDAHGNVVDAKNWVVYVHTNKKEDSSRGTLTTPSSSPEADGVILPSNESSVGKRTNNSANTQENSVESKSENIRNSVRASNGMDADETRRIVTEQIKHLMDNKNVDAMQKKDLNKMLNQIRFATPENVLERVQDVQRTVRGIETRILGSQIDDLLKLKTQDYC